MILLVLTSNAAGSILILMGHYEIRCGSSRSSALDLTAARAALATADEAAPLVAMRAARESALSAAAAKERAWATQLAALTVVGLARRKWSDAKIAKELGMDADEVLRLKQMTGLADLFRGREFSEAWEPEA